MEKEKFYITTPIYYPSDKLHIGHAYCTVIADALARYHRMKGRDVFFLTGSDEHGQKIQDIAKKNGLSPKEYVDGIVSTFKELWEKMAISYDDFIRTTDEKHKEGVQFLFQRLFEKEDIYLSNYEGLYCTPCESFWLERQLINGNCPDCGRAVKKVTEESYFFRLSKYQERLLEHIEKNPDFIQPVSRRNEMLNFIKNGLEDLCVSRTTFDWGIKVPFDSKHVVYVWLDALTNYITALDYKNNGEKFKQFWPADVHLVGKEIARFHAIIWPAVLMSLSLPLPKQIYGHGWLVMEGDKMSKSKGNIVDPLLLIDKYGVDAIRYFLLREIQLGQDGVYTQKTLLNRINADLANDLGNLLHRTINMLNKFNEGLVIKGNVIEDIDLELLSLNEKTVSEYYDFMDNMEINQALKTVWHLIGRSNKYIDETAPWSLAKQEGSRERLNTVLYNLIESLRVIAILLMPFMPETAKKIYREIGLEKESILLTDFSKAFNKGKIQENTKVVKQPTPIFPRIDLEKELASKEDSKMQDNVAKLSEISIEDFAKVEIKVAKILAVEKVAKADRLLLLTVDIGNETRKIISGIAQFYTPEELIGLDVAMITNLKTAKIRGIESKGMVLAASCGERLQVVTVNGMPPGSKIK